ncbi:hypothetical protein [Alkalihalobacillus pseudalcaliphilus]|uniref:hypothetical protein n=1 Tax=Alkalihalobacillus pseudalcaliphilus TaxID=79884 RepID=UPI00064D8565|nr:hypothetical protein [Alkalihalobacillus pseudalcaliphilus]KMK74836.1 hypothetical protein AB990_18200 [Alkalihalobacillus pseudalcaliphilus]
MELFTDILMAVLPLLIVGTISVFVIRSMIYNYKKGKYKEEEQNQSVNLLTYGMIMGAGLGILLSMFSPISMLYAVSIGPGIGFLVGYFIFDYKNKVRYS